MENKRRNLSGIFIFEKFDTDSKRKPTCFEDCTEETQDKWLNSLEPEALRSLSKMLGKTLIELADYAGIVKGDSED
jgi:hypothetical protein